MSNSIKWKFIPKMSTVKSPHGTKMTSFLGMYHFAPEHIDTRRITNILPLAL